MSRRPAMAKRAPDPRLKRQPLPGMLGEIERACGYAAAEKFALTFGGQHLYVPLIIDPSHPIAKAVGIRAARVIAENFGNGGGRGGTASGNAWAVPLADAELKYNIARRLRLAGLSRNAIVKEMRARYRLTISVGRVTQLCGDLPAAESHAMPPAPRPLPPADPTFWDYLNMRRG